MKRLTFFMSMIFISLNTLSGQAVTFEENPHAHTLTPEEEEQYYFEARQKGNFELLNFRFDQTDWRECTDNITGNYKGYNCANRRMISVILKDFIDDYLPQCVQESLDSISAGDLDQVHIIHNGILGDRRHSPRSLHAENRAIDIHAFKITTYDGSTKTYYFKDNKNNSFFNSFRSCWGNAVHKNNGCPYYNGLARLTGSIGKEDRNHQNHLHTSIPYCVSNRYGNYYYRK